MKDNFFKAAVLEKIGKKLKIITLPIKEPQKNQVLVKIKYTGVCRSQIMEIEGNRENSKWLPHLLGHEASGLIVKIGKNVKNFKKGDRVFLSWIKSNNKDCSAIKYYYKNKIINAGKVTTFSKHALVSSNRVYHLPKSINLKVGALLGCALPTGFGMVINSLYKDRNKKILIIGMGGVGLSSLIAAYSLNYINVDVLEKNKIKINKIKLKINKDNFNYFENIKDIKNNYYDNVIETSGDVKIISKSLDFINNKGKVVFASHPESHSKINIFPHDLIKGKKIIGSWGGQIKFKRDLIKIMKILNNFRSIEKLFFNKVYSLEKINLAIKDLKMGKVIRPLIKF